jgi:hypothetical protein
MKLFTIKATLTSNLTPYLGQQLSIRVTGLDAGAKVNGLFPIAGTTWTLAF